MASVAFVTTEHDEARPSPAKLPQVSGLFPGCRPPDNNQVVGRLWPRYGQLPVAVAMSIAGSRVGLLRFLGFGVMRFLGFCVVPFLGYCVDSTPQLLG